MNTNYYYRWLRAIPCRLAGVWHPKIMLAGIFDESGGAFSTDSVNRELPVLLVFQSDRVLER